MVYDITKDLDEAVRRGKIEADKYYDELDKRIKNEFLGA
jgi:hypothetical protein